MSRVTITVEHPDATLTVEVRGSDRLCDTTTTSDAMSLLNRAVADVKRALTDTTGDPS